MQGATGPGRGGGGGGREQGIGTGSHGLAAAMSKYLAAPGAACDEGTRKLGCWKQRGVGGEGGVVVAALLAELR